MPMLYTLTASGLSRDYVHTSSRLCNSLRVNQRFPFLFECNIYFGFLSQPYEYISHFPTGTTLVWQSTATRRPQAKPQLQSQTNSHSNSQQFTSKSSSGSPYKTAHFFPLPCSLPSFLSLLLMCLHSPFLCLAYCNHVTVEIQQRVRCM